MFSTKDEAAVAVLSILDPISREHGLELGGFIFEKKMAFTTAILELERKQVCLNLSPKNGRQEAIL